MSRLAITRCGVFTLLCLSLLGGCATRQPPLYYWGSYQTQVYGHFRSEKSPEEQIQALEKDREKSLAAGQALPPGFRAHLAMLYGNSGQSDQMIANLDAEKTQFPESSTFVDFLLKKFKH